jgi:membrane-bound PQQ-dependent dehydrogenase (glucose/quinate/shikimate family)
MTIIRQARSIAAVLSAGLFVFAADNTVAPTDWRYWGGDTGGTRYSALKQINSGNVSSLKRAWTFHTGEVTAGARSSSGRSISAFEATPLVAHGILYFTTASSRVIALEPETGKKIWEYDPQAGLPLNVEAGARKYNVNRGVAYWESGAEQRIIYGTYDGRLIALDARTGKPCRDFGVDGAINLRVGAADRFPDSRYSITSPPAIYKDLVITGAEVPEAPGHGPSGVVRAFHIRTGKLAWLFHTIPEPGEPGSETWEKGSSKDRTGANVWSVMSVDTERGMVFLPVGSASYDFYGGDRKGQNLYANCLVALDAASGKILWHYQMVHHDIWDYDLPAQPVLLTIQRDGKSIPAVVQVTKMGLVFILDRLTGEPLFPVEERLVPASNVPGEAAWPTQPFPLKPPPLSRISITRDDLTTVPESREYCAKQFDSLVAHGLFTPYLKESTLVLPGTLGGATWSGGSFDPTLGYLFVNTNETGAVGQMTPQPPGSPTAFKRTSERGGYARFWDENNRLCVKPPWGNLTAINIRTGEFAWRVPLGITEELEAKGIKNTGAPNLGGSIVTAGGLVFIAGTIDSHFRAFDSKTGKLLWETKLEASGHALPMTFAGRDGKQYVVIAAGGAGYFPTPASDTLDAFSLP